MSTKLQSDTAARIIESSFLPLRCTVESADRGRKVRVQIFESPDSHSIHDDEYPLEQAHNVRRLRATIAAIREHVEDMGYPLEAWAFPNEI